MRKRDWVKFPSQWIDDGGLRRLQWRNASVAGSDNTSALMVLAPLSHAADEAGLAICTYDNLTVATGLSRAKVASGLSVLADLGVIERNPAGRSSFRVNDYITGSWSKLPARALYSGDRIVGFQLFKLRSIAELNALKLYYLLVRRRSNNTNMAHLSYGKIEEYAGIERHRIRPAISVLLNAGLIHVERTESLSNEHWSANAYRLVGLDSHRHFGTLRRDGDLGLPG